MPILDPRDHAGRSFLLRKEDGQSLMTRTFKSFDEFEGDLSRDSSRMKFVCSMKDETIKEIFTCNELLDHINNSEEDDLVEWKFKPITVHEVSLVRSPPNCNGSPYNLRIEWENWKVTNEALNIIATDDPFSYDIYGRDHNLLEKHGWKRFKCLAKRDKKLLRIQN